MEYDTMMTQSYQSKPPVAWTLAFTALVIALTLFGGCTEPLAPMMPEWDVDANVPLVNHTYTMEDMLSEDDVLRISENGEQVLVVTQRYPLSDICVGDHLAMDDHPFIASETFSAIAFDLPDYLDQQLDVFTLFPTLPRGVQTVGSIRNDLGISIAIDTREYFEEMTFAAGRLVLGFANNVAIPLRIEAIRLVGLDGKTLAQLSWNQVVQPGASASLPAMPLDGLTLRNNMKLAFDISSPGSGGTSVDLSSAMTLGVRGVLRDTDILSVRGYLPSQDLQYHRNVDIATTSGMRVRNAHVRHGSLQFDVRNHFSVGAQMSVTLQNVTRSGSPLQVSGHVNPKASTLLTLDIASADLQLLDETDLVYDIHIVTDDASTQAVLVKISDSVAVTGHLRDIQFESLTGTLAPTTLQLRRMEYSDFNVGKTFDGSVQLDQARMWASLRNTSVLPIGVRDASVLGKNNAGSSASLRVTPLELGAQSETTVDFEHAQVVSFLNSFTPQYPDSLGMEGTFVLNPSGGSISTSLSDSVVGDLYVEFPLRFTQVSGSVVDTVDLVFDETTRAKMTEVNEGTLTFNVENHLPASVLVEAEFLDAAGKVVLVPVSVDNTPLQVQSAPVDAAGYVSASVTETLTLYFSGDDFTQLSRAVSVRFRLSFTASENSTATFRSTDYVRIRGFARLNVSSTITEK